MVSRFHLHGYTDSTSPRHIEECDTANTAVGIGRRLAARGLVVFAYDERHERDLALFVGTTMLPNRSLVPADNPLLAVAASGPARGATGQQQHRAPPPR